jgi:hypothetical protein
MTGIDQLEENTQSIDKINSDISDFMKNQVPFFGLISSQSQTFEGVKTFTNSIIGCGIDPLNKNPIVFNSRGRYKLCVSETDGTTIFGPLNIADKTIAVSKVIGLQSALDNPTIPAGFISGSQVKFFTIMGGNIALDTIENFNIKDKTITGAKLATDISIDTTGDITLTGTAKIKSDYGTIKYLTIGTNAYVPNLYVASIWVTDLMKLESNPQLHISIPFVPLLNDTVTIGEISFFVPNISAVTNPTVRYRHPFSYKIHGISVLYNKETNANTATINLYSYALSGGGTKLLLGTAVLLSNSGKSCDYFTFPKPIYVGKDFSLGGDHKYSTTADKQVSYVLWGYQS